MNDEPLTDRRMDGWTDRQTDGQTDTHSSEAIT